LELFHWPIETFTIFLCFSWLWAFLFLWLHLLLTSIDLESSSKRQENLLCSVSQARECCFLSATYNTRVDTFLFSTEKA
jgi:predicted Zn-dependent protease